MFWNKNKRKKEKLFLKDVMTADPETVAPSYHLVTAKRLMAENNIRHLPVVEKGKVIGIISDRDVKLADLVYKNRPDEEVRVGDICLFEPYVVSENTELRQVLEKMLAKKYGCVVVEKNQKVTGIFTMVDAGKILLRYLA